MSLALLALLLLLSMTHTLAILPLIWLSALTISLKILIISAHPLESLLSLEALTLLSFFLLIISPSFPPSTFFLMFFTLAVAEASTGLGVLINLTRHPSTGGTPPL